MNNTIDHLDSTRIELNRDGKPYTGIKISPTGRPDIWNLRSGSTRDTAWIYRAGRIEEWPVEGYIEHQGRYCIGPRFEGERFSRIISKGKMSLPVLRKIITAFMLISNTQEEPDSFDPSSVFLLNDGAVLVLSPSLAGKQRHCYSEEELFSQYELYKHPDMKGTAALSYSFVILAYIALAGVHPFGDRRSSPEDRPEEFRERTRRADFVPISLRKPEICPEIAAFIDSILEGNEDPGGLKDIQEILERIEKEPAPALSQEESLRAAGLVRRRENRIHQKAILRRFFHRYRIPLVIVGICVLAGALLTANILQKASLPPPTRGLEPEQVVRLFYESMNRLDHDTMDACTIDGAGSRYIESAVRLTVITRVTKAYSVGGPPPFLSAQEWIDSGLPPLEQGQFVFGAADISIKETAEEEFLVTYIFAQPAGGDLEEADQSIRIMLSEHRERLRLRRDREDYHIYSLDTEEIREIESFLELKNE